MLLQGNPDVLKRILPNQPKEFYQRLAKATKSNEYEYDDNDVEDDEGFVVHAFMANIIAAPMIPCVAVWLNMCLSALPP